MPHIHEKIDYAVDVFIVNDGAVLLRKHDKYNIWLGVGGHIELDEDPTQAARREVKEEVGLEVDLLGKPLETNDADEEVELLLPRFLNRYHINETHEHIAFVYFAVSGSRKVIPENENDEWKWFTRMELNAAEDVKDRIKTYARAALDAYKGET